MLPQTPGHQSGGIRVGELELLGDVRAEILVLPQIAVEVVPLLVLGKLVRLQLFLFHQIHAQGLILRLQAQKSIPIQPQTGVARLTVAELHIVGHHHDHRCLEAHLAVGCQQGPVGSAQIPADGPLPHGGRLCKGGDDSIHRQLGGGSIHLVVDAVGNHIAGVLVQFHIAEGICIF